MSLDAARRQGSELHSTALLNEQRHRGGPMFPWFPTRRGRTVASSFLWQGIFRKMGKVTSYPIEFSRAASARPRRRRKAETRRGRRERTNGGYRVAGRGKEKKKKETLLRSTADATSSPGPLKTYERGGKEKGHMAFRETPRKIERVNRDRASG